MVEPRSTEETRRANRSLAIGFVLLVGGSSVLMAAYGGATLFQIVLVGALGLVVGAGLLFAIGARP